MREQVLIYSRFPKALMQRIGERFELMDAAGKPPHEVFTADQLSSIRAMVTAGSTPLRGDMMDRLPKLGAIVCYGTGYDGIDLNAAAQRNIAVGHSPGANAASVADIAVILMLAATRRLLAADNYVRSGDWAAAKPSPMMRPQPGMLGRKVGVYGMGEIGAVRSPPVSRRSRPRSAISAAAATTYRINIFPPSRRWRIGAAY